MIKVAVVTNAADGSSTRNGIIHLMELLKIFGITYDIFMDGSLTKAQLNSNYDCAFCFETKKATDTGALVGGSLVAYSSGDKPIFYINGQNRSLPSDFPIIPFVQADTSTYYQHETSLFSTEDMKLIGSCLKDNKGRHIWGTFANYVYPSTQTDYAYYRVDTSKLDANREILLQLDDRLMGISSPPSNHAVVVRYYNRYFLPMLAYEPRLFSVSNGYGMINRIMGLPALLYCMSHAGLSPDRKLIANVEIDHPLGVSGYSGYSDEQKLQNLLATWTWVIENFKNSGLNIVCGVTTNNTRDSSWGHVRLYNNYDTARKIHNLFLNNEGGLLSFCWHDHSFDVGNSGSYTRHSGGSYGYPANITDIDCNFGTNQSATMNLRSRVPLLVHVEDQLNIMQNLLGFKSAFAAPFYHLNFATNSHGEFYTIRLLNELFGVKSVRSVINSQFITTGQGTQYRNYFYGSNAQKVSLGGVDVIPSVDLVLTATDFATINTFYGLNATGDNAKIYRRFMAMQMNRAFNLFLMCGNVYWHEAAILEANLNKPTSRFWETGNVNMWVELFSELDSMINFIPDWIKWGTIEDIRRNRIYARAN